MINDTLGDVATILAWANSIIESRPPDFTIEDGEKQEYMRRWFIVPRNPAGGCYVHQVIRSDKDVHHDHPWDNTSYVLDGTYIEEVLYPPAMQIGKDGPYMGEPRTQQFIHPPGSIIHRKATDAHRLILAPGEIVTTLFYLGPWQRDWGFHCPNGWVPWWEFTAEDKGRVGRGCGEHG